jgi:hypothetical protein
LLDGTHPALPLDDRTRNQSTVDAHRDEGNRKAAMSAVTVIGGMRITDTAPVLGDIE